MKVKKKYTITITTMIVATIAMFTNVKIQDNWVKIIEFCLGTILGGFSIKNITDIFKNK